MPKGAPGQSRKPGGGRKPKQPGRQYERITVRISREAAKFINASGNASETIEKLAREKMNYEAESETTDNRLLGIARAMHGELCDCDDKNCNTVNDIYSWLASGDNETLTEADTPDLVKEWREYYGE